MATAPAVLDAVRAVPDPEVPVVTIEDLGILRELSVDDDVVRVVITPTYSGCPAMEAIERAVGRAITAHGFTADVRLRLAPAWTTDWITQRGREALSRFGIAPPAHVVGGPTTVPLSVRRVTCPLCGSSDTEQLSRFGATACKALRRCRACREPFEEFKAL